MTEKPGWQNATARIRCDEQGRFPSHIGPVSLNQISVSRAPVCPGETTPRAIIIIHETNCSMSVAGGEALVTRVFSKVIQKKSIEIQSVKFKGHVY